MEALHCVVMLFALGNVGVKGDDYWGYWLPAQANGDQEYALHFSPALWSQVQSGELATFSRLLNDEILRGDLSFDGLKGLHLFVGDQELDAKTSNWFMETLLKTLESQPPGVSLKDLGSLAQAQFTPRSEFPSSAAKPDYRNLSTNLGGTALRNDNSRVDPYSLQDTEPARVREFQNTSDYRDDAYARSEYEVSPAGVGGAAVSASETSPRANRPRSDLGRYENYGQGSRESYQVAENGLPRVAASTQARANNASGFGQNAGGQNNFGQNSWGQTNTAGPSSGALTRTADNYSAFPSDQGSAARANGGFPQPNSNFTQFPANTRPAANNVAAGQGSSTLPTPPPVGSAAANPPYGSGNSPYGGYSNTPGYGTGSASSAEPSNHANRFTAMAFIVAAIAMGGNVYQFLNQLRMERRFQRLLYRMQDRQDPPQHLAVTAFDYGSESERDYEDDDRDAEYAGGGGGEERRRRRRSA